MSTINDVCENNELTKLLTTTKNNLQTPHLGKGFHLIKSIESNLLPK